MNTSSAAVDPAWLVGAIIGGFLIIFPAFWCFIVWLLSRIGGWHRLAQRYPASRLSDLAISRRHRGLTGMVGVVRYRNILALDLTTDGFFLGVMPLFRIGHPRLFIPWHEITARKPRQVLWWKAETLSIGQPLIATITLPADLIPSGIPAGSATPA